MCQWVTYPYESLRTSTGSLGLNLFCSRPTGAPVTVVIITIDPFATAFVSGGPVTGTTCRGARTMDREKLMWPGIYAILVSRNEAL